MSIGGRGFTSQRRVSDEERMRYDRQLSDRHRLWGADCPATDLDFALMEYNHGVPVAIVDYKHHLAKLERTNAATYDALSYLVDMRSGRHLPFLITRYWDDIWAFSVLGVNDPAREWLGSMDWIDMTEQQYVRRLYALRKDVLTAGDCRYIERLRNVMPPAEEVAS